MKCDARRVWNVAEEYVLHWLASRLKDGRHKCRAESLAFAVDVGIVRTGKVYALEHAGGDVVRVGEWVSR